MPEREGVVTGKVNEEGRAVSVSNINAYYCYYLTYFIIDLGRGTIM